MLPDSFFGLSKKDRDAIEEYFKKQYNYTSNSNILKLMFDNVKPTEVFESYEFKVRYKLRETNKVREILFVETYPPKKVKSK